MSQWWGDGNHCWKALDLRLDRKRRKRGGVLRLYYPGQLSSTHRKDYSINDHEESWLQVKFPDTAVLLSVIYRPLDIRQLLQVTGAPLWRNSRVTSFIILLKALKYGFRAQNSFHENFTSINTLKCLTRIMSLRSNSLRSNERKSFSSYRFIKQTGPQIWEDRKRTQAQLLMDIVYKKYWISASGT